jgi:hypothetical protein
VKVQVLSSAPEYCYKKETMSSEVPTGSLELTGDFHIFANADKAARIMNGQNRGMAQ